MSEPALKLTRTRSGKAKPCRTNFTKASLEALKPRPGKRDAWLYDTKAPGLAFCVTAGGKRSFYLLRRIGGKPERVRIGTYGQWTIDNARDEAARLNGEIAEDRNPAAEKRRKRGAMTLRDLFERYVESHLRARGKSERTIITDESRFETCLAAWGERKISSITVEQVAELHTEIKQRKKGKRGGGAVTANRAVQMLRRLFNYAAKPPLSYKTDNPTIGIEMFPESSRERFIEPDEMPRFYAALEAEPNDTLRDYFKLALLTGARRSNVAAMQWADLNLERGKWTITAEQSKSGKPMVVALAPAAVELLRTRRERMEARARKLAEKTGDKPMVSDYVFPSKRRNPKCPHLRETKTAWQRILDRAGIKDLRLHDLRRTFGSWQAAAGASLQVIGKSLGHSDPATTLIYARLHMATVEKSVHSAVDAMLKAAEAPQRTDTDKRDNAHPFERQAQQAEGANR